MERSVIVPFLIFFCCPFRRDYAIACLSVLMYYGPHVKLSWLAISLEEKFK